MVQAWNLRMWEVDVLLNYTMNLTRLAWNTWDSVFKRRKRKEWGRKERKEEKGNKRKIKERGKLELIWPDFSRKAYHQAEINAILGTWIRTQGTWTNEENYSMWETVRWVVWGQNINSIKIQVERHSTKHQACWMAKFFLSAVKLLASSPFHLAHFSRR